MHDPIYYIGFTAAVFPWGILNWKGIIFQVIGLIIMVTSS